VHESVIPEGFPHTMFMTQDTMLTSNSISDELRNASDYEKKMKTNMG